MLDDRKPWINVHHLRKQLQQKMRSWLGKKLSAEFNGTVVTEVASELVSISEYLCLIIVDTL